MLHSADRRGAFAAGALLPLILLACTSGTNDGWTGFVATTATSPLLRLLDQEVTVSCQLAPGESDHVTAVTADLSQLDGTAAQPLTRNGDTWSWTGRLTPSLAGERQVTFTALTDTGATHTTSTTVRVNDPQGTDDPDNPPTGNNQPPTIANPTATAPNIVGLLGPATVSCTAEDQDGTVASVVADLRAINGPRDAALAWVATRLDRATWTWSGNLTPNAEGTFNVPLTATDNQGATGTGQAAVTVGPGFEISIGPRELSVDIFDQPQTFSATITPAPPPGAEVTYHWTTAAMVNGSLFPAGYFSGGQPTLPASQQPSSLDTAANSTQWFVGDIPPRLPLDNTVRVGATIKIGEGQVGAGGPNASATVTISQKFGITVPVEFALSERRAPDGALISRGYEAFFQWPRNGASLWVLTTLTPLAPGSPDDHKVYAQINQTGGPSLAELAPNHVGWCPRHAYLTAVSTGFEEPWLTWFQNQMESIHEQYKDWQLIVEAWPAQTR